VAGSAEAKVRWRSTEVMVRERKESRGWWGTVEAEKRVSSTSD